MKAPITAPLAALVFALFFPLLLHAQSEKITFYYTVDKQVYRGYLYIEYKLYESGSARAFPDILEYDSYNYRNLKVQAEVRSLKWATSAHASRYKLAFADDLNEPGDGIRKAGVFTQYLKEGGRKKINYSFESIYELTPTGFIMGFAVLRNDVMYRSIDEADPAQGEFVGFGFHIKPIMLVPPRYVESEEGEIEVSMLLFELVIDEYNEKLNEISLTVAEVIKEGDYDRVDSYIDNPTNMGSIAGAKKSRSYDNRPREDPELKAFSEAKRGNSITAYEDFLDRYPSGRFSRDAEARIVELTPFEFSHEEEIEGVYAVHHIKFEAGVGSKSPVVTLTNNEDWSIKHDWVSKKEVEIKIPEEKETEVTFSLGKKDTTLRLSHRVGSLQADIAFTGNTILVSKMQGGRAPYELEVIQNGIPVFAGLAEAGKANRYELSAMKLEKGPFTVNLYDSRGIDPVTQSFELGKKAAEEATPMGASGPGGGKKGLWAALLAVPILGLAIYLLYKKYVEI